MFLTLSGGGPDIKDSAGNPWTSTFINANGDRPWICAATSRRSPGRKWSTSTGEESVRGLWNEGQGPWPEGMEWDYIEKPEEQWLGTAIRQNIGAEQNPTGSPE